MKNEDASTREAVASSVLSHGPSTAVVLAQRLGLTPAGIRRHLDALVADGILEAREPRIPNSPRLQKSRGRGRPSKVFVVTDRGREHFAHAYDDLAASALRFMKSQTGSIKTFATSRADELKEKLSDSTGSLEALAAGLTTEGFAASVEHMAHGSQICQHHCPVAHVAAEFPELCEAETIALSELTGSHVQRLATIAHGDGVCTTFIPQNRTTTAGRG